MIEATRLPFDLPSVRRKNLTLVMDIMGSRSGYGPTRSRKPHSPSVRLLGWTCRAVKVLGAAARDPI